MQIALIVIYRTAATTMSTNKGGIAETVLGRSSSALNDYWGDVR